MESANSVDIYALHERSKIKWVDLEDLNIDKSYQRMFSQNWAAEIGSDFDDISAEIILVSDRGDRNGGPIDGGMWVLSGQHRYIGAVKAGRKRLQARVIDTSAIDDPGAIEALFRLRTNHRLADKSTERFKAQVRAGNEESVEIVKILASFDTEINERVNPEGGINAIATVERIYRLDGKGTILKEVLSVIHEAYGFVGGKNSTSTMLSMISWFIMQHGQEASRERFIEKLRTTGLAAISNRGHAHKAAMGGALWVGYYRGMVEFYNAQLQGKSRLDWKLRGASTFKGDSAWS